MKDTIRSACKAPDTIGYNATSPMPWQSHGTALAQEPYLNCPRAVYGSRPVPWPHLQRNVVDDHRNKRLTFI